MLLSAVGFVDLTFSLIYWLELSDTDSGVIVAIGSRWVLSLKGWHVLVLIFTLSSFSGQVYCSVSACLSEVWLRVVPVFGRSYQDLTFLWFIDSRLLPLTSSMIYLCTAIRLLFLKLQWLQLRSSLLQLNILDHLSRFGSRWLSSIEAFNHTDLMTMLLFRVRSHLDCVQKVRDRVVKTVLRVLKLRHLVKTTFVHVEWDILLFAELSQ